MRRHVPHVTSIYLRNTVIYVLLQAVVNELVHI